MLAQERAHSALEIPLALLPPRSHVPPVRLFPRLDRHRAPVPRLDALERQEPSRNVDRVASVRFRLTVRDHEREEVDRDRVERCESRSRVDKVVRQLKRGVEEFVPAGNVAGRRDAELLFCCEKGGGG